MPVTRYELYAVNQRGASSPLGNYSSAAEAWSHLTWLREIDQWPSEHDPLLKDPSGAFWVGSDTEWVKLE